MVKSRDLPPFCPKEFRQIVTEKFRTHLHQHPTIPFNDEDGTHLTADEIHHGAVKDMYDFCQSHNLSQVWAYLWNRWYTPNQWVLWARSADEAIPRLKTTMVVESLWKNIKHRDLAMYNRPRLDFVTHLVITNVLPRVERTLDYVRDRRRVGRAKPLAGWQTDFRADWLDMSRVDEHRLVEKELKWLKAPANTKGRTERLAEIAEEAHRPHGSYHTDLDTWTCSCPSFLVSRFLLCKHLVRMANARLKDSPRTDLAFFLHLRRNHYPPFYSIEGIHYDKESANEPEVEIHILGRRDAVHAHNQRSALVPPPSQTPSEQPANMAVIASTSSAGTGRSDDGRVERIDGSVERALFGFEDNTGCERVSQHCQQGPTDVHTRLKGLLFSCKAATSEEVLR